MARRAEQTFTKRTLTTIKPPTHWPSWYVSKELPGFLLRVDVDGTKTFATRYTLKRTGQRKFVTLGRYGVVTYDEARGKARELLAAAALGDDPRPARVMTWGTWIDRHVERLDVKRPEEQLRYLGLSSEKAKRTGAATDDTFREIRRRWKDRPLDSISREDVETARAVVRQGGRARANRFLANIAAAFEGAARAGLLAKNPCRGIRPDRESPGRDRVLTPDELRRLLAAADEERDVFGRAAIYLLAATGARSGEIRGLTWESVDLDGRRVRLPDSKSGRARFLPLPALAVDLLRSLPRLGRYVVVGADPDVPRFDFKSVWRRVSTRAGIKGATPHDLRRTFGLELTRLAGIRVASLALGHASIAITESSYAPEAFSAIQDAAEERVRRLFAVPDAKPVEPKS